MEPYKIKKFKIYKDVQGKGYVNFLKWHTVFSGSLGGSLIDIEHIMLPRKFMIHQY